jgi:hypothetical protein
MDRVKNISALYKLYADRIGKNKLDKEEFQPLVLNMAYLEIAISKRNNIPYDARTIFNDYTDAAINVIPEYINEVNNPMYSAMYFGFAATAEWDGLWNFLRDYFDSKLGIRIDDQERKVLRFDSSYHERYEAKKFISKSDVDRKVLINLSTDFKNAQISVSETLSNKEANLISKNENIYIYLGTDPDFMFKLYLDSYNNVEQFSIIRIDRNIEIIYFE